MQWPMHGMSNMPAAQQVSINKETFIMLRRQGGKKEVPKDEIDMEQSFAQYTIDKQSVPTMYFIGVTTGQSSIMRLFPIWAEVLGLDQAQLVGVDLLLHAPAEQYQQAIAQIKYDPLSLGALVTTHKIDLLHAASSMFDTLDRYAQLCQEVSCITKRDGHLIGYAKDPVNSGFALGHILEPGYWGRSGGHVLFLGAGC